MSMSVGVGGSGVSSRVVLRDCRWSPNPARLQTSDDDIQAALEERASPRARLEGAQKCPHRLVGAVLALFRML